MELEPPALHKVTASELPMLKDWLDNYLPDSRKIFFTVLETIRGRWTGTVFYTLGWPDILAVGEGLIGLEDSPCALYHREPRTTSVYAPIPSNLETLLLYPGFLDWSQAIYFTVVTSKLRSAIQRVSAQTGGQVIVFENALVEVTQEEMPGWPVPDGFELRTLDSDIHTDLVLSFYDMSKNHSDIYIRELLRKFPAVGLFEKKSGQCVGLELRYEYGTLGMLSVKEEFRGRGFGKVISAEMARSFFREGYSAAANVIESNEPSMRMHTNCGFKKKVGVDFLIHHMEPEEECLQKMGFRLASLKEHILE